MSVKHIIRDAGPPVARDLPDATKSPVPVHEDNSVTVLYTATQSTNLLTLRLQSFVDVFLSIFVREESLQ